jgi:hypothetical protein
MSIEYEINGPKLQRSDMWYRFKQIFRFEIHFTGFQKAQVFRQENSFFTVRLLVLGVSNPFGNPGLPI